MATYFRNGFEIHKNFDFENVPLFIGRVNSIVRVLNVFKKESTIRVRNLTDFTRFQKIPGKKTVP